MTQQARAAAWAFWLARVDIVEKAARTFAFRARVDFDDFRQDLMLPLVEAHVRYDETRSGANTWAHIQAKAVQSTAVLAFYGRLGTKPT